MKNIVLLLTITLFISCETKKDVQSNIENLKIERTKLQSEINTLQYGIDKMSTEYHIIDEKLKEAKIYQSGKTPKYVLKLKLKQSHFSLDISKHIKDAMNAIEFELPVDKDFYNQVSIGTNIVDEFRFGSFILNGSYGDWEMTVNVKEIKK